MHAGWRADPATGAVAVPIYQTTSYQFNSAEHAANLFALKELGNIYTRIGNPTNDVLEKRVAALEGGVAGLALASGQAASGFALQNLARAGDNVVSSTDLYGGTWNLFANTLKDQGIEVRFVDPADPENFARATDARTRAYYAETLPNPKLIAFPIAEVAAIGRPLGIPLIMDNTAAPLLVRPFDHGAAIIVYSSTKYLGGHGTSIGGLHHRRRQFSLGGIPGAPARAQHAGPELSRRDLDARRSSRSGRSPISSRRARRCCAISARDVAVQRLPDLARHRDAGAAHRAPLRQRRGGRRLPRQAAGSRQGHPPEPADRRGRASAPTNISRRGQGGLVGFEIKGGQARRGGASSTRCNSSITSPISATRARSPSIPRRPPIRSFRRRISSRPAFPRAMSGCRSASSISTTSSPIWIRR